MRYLVFFLMLIATPVYAQDYIGPFLCTGDISQCDVMMTVKLVGARGQRYQDFCPNSEFGLAPRDLEGCLAKGLTFLAEGWSMPAQEPGIGVEIHRLTTVSCLWVHDAGVVKQHYPGLIADKAFFFTDMPR